MTIGKGPDGLNFNRTNSNIEGVRDGYGGVNWRGFSITDTRFPGIDRYDELATFATSPAVAAFSPGSGRSDFPRGVIESRGFPFDLQAVSIEAAGFEPGPSHIRIVGLRDGEVVARLRLVLEPDRPERIVFDASFDCVDEVRIHTDDGFAIDDLLISAATPTFEADALI